MPLPELSCELTIAFTKRFERVWFRNHQLTATITGWVETPENNLVPVVGAITNREATSGDCLSEFVGGPACCRTSAGVPLSDEMRHTLDRRMRGALPRRPSPAVIVNLFLYAIRQEATKNSLIGRSTFTVAYSRAAAGYALAHTTATIEVVVNQVGQILEHAVTQTFIPGEVQ